MEESFISRGKVQRNIYSCNGFRIFRVVLVEWTSLAGWIEVAYSFGECIVWIWLSVLVWVGTSTCWDGVCCLAVRRMRWATRGDLGRRHEAWLKGCLFGIVTAGRR